MYEPLDTRMIEQIEAARTKLENITARLRNGAGGPADAAQVRLDLDAVKFFLRNSLEGISGQADLNPRTGAPPSDGVLMDSSLKYYRLVDEQRIDEMLDLFSETATYSRCESVYRGIDEIANFYRNERKIRGRHEIENVWIISRTGIVEGIFTGKGADDQPKQVRFADFFTFDDEGKIQNRNTYLMLGGSYVKE
jgi:hypothetical protein